MITNKKSETKNFLAEGYGTYIHSNGDRYKGEFKNHEKSGKGTSTYLSGDKYIGSFKTTKT
jgi:hypothetical protein